MPTIPVPYSRQHGRTVPDHPPPGFEACQTARWASASGNDLVRRLHDGPEGHPGLEPVQERLEVRGRDRVGVASVADVVEDELHPSAAVLLRGGDVSLDLRQL